MAPQATETKTFDFGENWEKFSIGTLNSAKFLECKNSLASLIGVQNLNGLSFLDVGCGSGVFSISAKELGAAKVVGIDVNPKCIATSKRNQEVLLGKTSGIAFVLLSVFDEAGVRNLGPFDVTYAWGSLHQTGDMWRAVDIASQTVKKEGLFVLALYNKHFTAPFWDAVKYVYNYSPSWMKKALAIVFTGIIFVAKFAVTFKNPLKKERGMNFYYDVVDWIGGYPCQYASKEEVLSFMATRGFRLVRHVPPAVPTGNNEFVFVRS